MIDNQEEIFDIIDESDRVIGQRTRGEVHKNPSLIHRSIAIVLVRGDQVFLQRRSMTKDSYPGYWTLSVTGHVDSGETYEDASKREMFEEIGIRTTKPLQFITEQVIRYPNETERMRFYRYDADDDVSLDPDEITEGKFFTISENFLRDVLPSMQTTPFLIPILQKIFPQYCSYVKG